MATRTCVICGATIAARGNTKTCAGECRVQLRRTNGAQSYSSDIEGNRQRRRAYYYANRDRALARQADFKAQNPDVLKARQKAYRESERGREYMRAWREENAEHSRQYKAEYRRANKDKVREWKRNTKARHIAALKLIREIETKGLEALL